MAELPQKVPKGTPAWALGPAGAPKSGAEEELEAAIIAVFIVIFIVAVVATEAKTKSTITHGTNLPARCRAGHGSPASFFNALSEHSPRVPLVMASACRYLYLAPMNKPLKKTALLALPLAGIVALCTLPGIPGTNISFTVPYALEGPGPTVNVLGEAEGKEVLQITGTKEQPTTGNLNMTSVRILHHLTMAEFLYRLATTDDTAVDLNAIFPPSMTQEETQKRNQMMFAQSEDAATVAAYNQLGRPLAAGVAAVEETSPAAGKVQAGDVVLRIDGEETPTPADVSAAVKRHKAGETITVTLRKDNGRSAEEEVTLAARPQPEAGEGAADGAASDSGDAAGQDAGYLGIYMRPVPADGVAITYNLEGIGGPSAGMMFALGVVDKLTEQQLTGGKFIAGTGTISPDGTVGPIGGIEHKIQAAADAGAEVFLSPSENCAEALKRKHKGLTIVRVDTLSQAVEQIERFNAGQPVQSCDS